MSLGVRLYEWVRACPLFPGDDLRHIPYGDVIGARFPELMELGHLHIDPFNPESLSNICYYLHFGRLFRRPKGFHTDGTPTPNIEPGDPASVEDAYHPAEEHDWYLLQPGESVLAQTLERVGISTRLMGGLANDSKLARLLVNHAGHDFIKPGHGHEDPFHLMLEVTNLNTRRLRIYPGLNAMRLTLRKLSEPALPYVPGTGMARVLMDGQDRS